MIREKFEAFKQSAFYRSHRDNLLKSISFSNRGFLFVLTFYGLVLVGFDSTTLDVLLITSIGYVLDYVLFLRNNNEKYFSQPETEYNPKHFQQEI